MNNIILRNCFYFNIVYLLVYYLTMLSGSSGFYSVPDIYVSYMGLLAFVLNFIIIISNRQIKVDKHFFSLFVIVMLLSILHILISPDPSIIPNSLSFIIPFSTGVVFEIVQKRKILDSKEILQLFVFSFICTVLLFFVYKFSSSYGTLGGSIHAAYFIVLLFPIIFMVEKDIYKYLAILVVLLVSILSFKRGAIISAALMSLFFVLLRIREVSTKEKFLNILLVIMVAFAIQYYYNIGGDDLERTITRLENLENDGGSGRDEIYTFFLNEIQNFSIGDHLFGRGAKATSLLDSDGLTAHNDWIELYYDYGFICFIIWAIFWYKQIRSCIRLIRERNKYVTMYASIIVAYFVMSMISHVMIYSYFSIVIIYLSYLKYNIYENRNPDLS